MRFYYGTSKQILEVPLDGALLRRTRMSASVGLTGADWSAAWEGVMGGFRQVSADSLQRRWVRDGSGPHPHDVADALGAAATAIRQKLTASSGHGHQAFVARVLGQSMAHLKLLQNADLVIAGFIVGCMFNTRAASAHRERIAALR